jgi:hypothetical protein
MSEADLQVGVGIVVTDPNATYTALQLSDRFARSSGHSERSSVVGKRSFASKALM